MKFKLPHPKKNVVLKKLESLESAAQSFTLAEKILFAAFSVLLLAGSLLLLNELNRAISVEIPARGGEMHEGVIGFPRFVNPVLAISDADRDLTSLVYSSLLKATPDGRLVLDAAQKIEISDDGLAYTVTLKENLVFHDGERLDADDVVFTVRKALDPLIKSPKRANWEGVGVEKIDEKTVQFSLPQPYTPFLENLTIGILPQHIWKDIPADQFPFSRFNTEAVGSGPYRIADIRKNSQGIPDRYTLAAFKRYTLGEPFISRLHMRFYPTESDLISAYARGNISAINSISTAYAAELSQNKTRIETHPLPRVFAVFFNQNQAPIFANREVREALDLAINRSGVVSRIFGEYATPLYSPVPAESVFDRQARKYRSEYINASAGSEKEKAVELLEQNGWKRNEESGIMEQRSSAGAVKLAFTLTTSSAPELKQTAELLAEEWRRIGADVSINIFETGDLNQEVIRPRQYDALLFGEIIGRDLDLYPFWHSSQRNDPGLNVALYTNSRADSALEEIRRTSDEEGRLESYLEFEREIVKDTPAVFLFSPDFIYIVPKKVRGLKLGTVTTPAERFLNVHEWYIQTDRVWEVFAQE